MNRELKIHELKKNKARTAQHYADICIELKDTVLEINFDCKINTITKSKE